MQGNHSYRLFESSSNSTTIVMDIRGTPVEYAFQAPSWYDYTRSTEENYRSDEPVFVGKYGNQRKVLDYSYHSHYRPERQLLHDQLIDHFHATRVHDRKQNAFCEAPLQNWIVFTAGAMGAGKSHTMTYLHHHNLFPLEAFVKVDPDVIRALLPEFQGYFTRDILTTGYLTQREVGYISEVLTLDALTKGKNVLLDSSMRDAAWFARYLEYLHDHFPLLRIAILRVDAPLSTIFTRALKREKITGRHVPESEIVDAWERVPLAMQILRPKVDFFATIMNCDDRDPYLSECVSRQTEHNCLSNWSLRLVKKVMENRTSGSGKSETEREIDTENETERETERERQSEVYILETLVDREDGGSTSSESKSDAGERKEMERETERDDDRDRDRERQAPPSLSATSPFYVQEEVEDWTEIFSAVWLMECPPVFTRTSSLSVSLSLPRSRSVSLSVTPATRPLSLSHSGHVPPIPPPSGREIEGEDGQREDRKRERHEIDENDREGHLSHKILEETKDASLLSARRSERRYTDER